MDPITVLIVLIFFIAFYKYVRLKQSHWDRLDVVSPKPLFFIGNYLENWLGKRNNIEIYDDLYTKYKHSERIIGLYQLLTPQIMILEPSLVKEILVKNFNHFQDTSFGSLIHKEADPLLSRNPFFLAGKEWKEKRAEITPAFSPSRLKAMFTVMENTCERIVTYLENRQNVGLEARELCSRFTCDVVSHCVLSADSQSFVHEEPQIRNMASKIFDQGMGVQLRFMISLVAPAISKLFQFQFVPKDTQNFFSDLMAQAVEQRQQTGISRQDYLEYLLQIQGKKHISDLELAANAVTFFLDGMDTSAVGIACVLYELAQHKDIQNRLRKELEGVSGYEALMEHEFLDMVFSEALRIHPPGGFIVRECTTPIDMDLKGNGNPMHIKKGDTLFIPVWSIHHDERIYKDPHKFNPDRFADGALKKYRDDGVYLTFGTGPRSCIGLKFAQAQSKACIATIIKNFEIQLDTQNTQLPLVLDPKDFLTLFTYYTGGLWLRFKRINA